MRHLGNLSPPPWMGEHLCRVSRSDRLPEAIFAHEGVGEDDEFSHDGGECNLRSFSVIAQALVEGCEFRVARGCRQDC